MNSTWIWKRGQTRSSVVLTDKLITSCSSEFHMISNHLTGSSNYVGILIWESAYHFNDDHMTGWQN